jgi:SOS-response transcriptional repressor LexA
MDGMTLHRKRRLRELIAAPPYRGSQKVFGDRVGLSEGRVSQLVDDEHSFGERSASNITSELRLDERYFEMGYETGESNTSLGPPITGRVPVISWVQAGAFTEAVESWDTDEWAETSAPVQRQTFALRVRGDSMEPLFNEGVIIVVEPDLDHNPGDYVIVRNGDEASEATFKQLVRDGGDLYLKPLNGRYPIKPLGTSQIIGVVREMILKFR